MSFYDCLLRGDTVYIVSENVIKSYLDTDLAELIKIDIVQQTESTNADVKARALHGEKEGYLLVSRKQTSGRGRLGRSFFSPGGTGIYMSLLLRPELSPEKTASITTVAAVSVCSALEKLGVSSPKIKWVNDIFVDGKKVCGILTEAVFSSETKTDYAVLGVGVNMYSPENGFPDDIKNIAGAVFQNEEPDLSNRFIAEFLNSFFSYYKKSDEGTYIEQYRKRCFVLGEKVSFFYNGKETEGVAEDVDNNCGLKVITADGRSLTLSSGEISVKLK